MFTESDLRELVEFTAPDPVLSVYLNTEPSAGNADAYRLRLRNMLKDIKLPEDVEAIERYFHPGILLDRAQRGCFFMPATGLLPCLPASNSRGEYDQHW
jgi:hypothetical protein